PLLNDTTLCAATVSKPKPLIVSVVAFAARFAVLLVTTGMTLATCTAAPLLTPLEATTAVKDPAMGFVVKFTVKDVAVAAVTVPIAPLLNVTTLLAAVVLKLVPLMVIVAALAETFAVLEVTVGVLTFATTVATCTAEPLDCEFVVTLPVR